MLKPFSELKLCNLIISESSSVSGVICLVELGDGEALDIVYCSFYSL